MCGLVGVLSYGSPLWAVDVSLFTDLLYVGALRGTDGTGLFTASKAGDQFRLKIGGPPQQLFSSPEHKELVKFLDKQDPMFLIGHNRYATVGAASTANSHPFKHGQTTLVHNGTITNFGPYAKEAKEFPVDSEALCFLIDKYGPEEVFSSIYGAWACIWYNAKENTLNIARNKERPLYAMNHPTFGAWYLASEKDMLSWVVNRKGMKPLTPSSIESHKWISFKLGESKPRVRPLQTPADKYQKAAEEAAAEATKRDGERFAKRESQHADKDSKIVYVASPPITTTPNYSGNGSYRLGAGGKTGVGPVVPLPAIVRKESWVQVQHLKDLSVGNTISVEMVDYDPVSDVKEGFRMTMLAEKYPDIEFSCLFAGEEGFESLVSATSIKATIRSILKSNNPPAVSRHRIVLADPEPEYTDSDILPAIVADNLLHTGE